MTDIKIDSEAVQSIVAKALLEGLDQEARDQLIEQALSYLITAPKPTGYGAATQLSPLQLAFQNATVKAANTLVTELFQKDEFKTRVDAAVVKFVNEQFQGDEWLYDSVGAAVGNQVGQLLRDRSRNE